MFLHGLKVFVCVALAIGGGYSFGVYNEKRLHPGGRDRSGYLIVGLVLLLLESVLFVAFIATP